jgi:ribosomal protein S18 acetylase RimI-like enzyme
MFQTQTIRDTAIRDGAPVPAICPATPSDAPVAADLIYRPMGRMADYIFGSDDPARAREVFAKLFMQPSNRFSSEYCDALTLEGEIVGLLLAYPAEILGSFSVPMARQLRELLGFGGMLRLLKRSLPLMGTKECEPDEYYIYTVSVLPGFQGHGLGKLLMERAETRALEAGLHKCSLGVTVDNTRAVRFYERLDYRIVDTVRIPHLEKAIDHPGYHRMIKTLSDTSSRRDART